MAQEKQLEKSIIKTLCYADVFDYPLTSVEIWKWLIECNNATIQQCDHELRKLKIVKSHIGYYFLNDKRNITTIRQQRENWARKKFKIAKTIASILKIIPSIKLIGLTGALSMNNAKKDDDIDLFIISSSNLLWTTRLLATLLIELIGKRRHPHHINVDNKICLNMFIDEDHLSQSQKERDLFSAHEILQMKPIYYKDQTYQIFLKNNLWVSQYLPNAFPKIYNYKLIMGKIEETLTFKIYFNLLKYFESFIKSIQLSYMAKRRTTEIISDGIIRFHPKDARLWILKSYHEKLKLFNLI